MVRAALRAGHESGENATDRRERQIRTALAPASNPYANQSFAPPARYPLAGQEPFFDQTLDSRPVAIAAVCEGDGA